MRAILLDRPGPVETLHPGEIPIPPVAPDDVRVRVHAVGLNPVDYKFAEVGNGIATWPHVLGVDIAGTIDAVGTGVSGWRIGQRVACFGDPWRRGGFADYAVVKAGALAIVPDTMSFETAAALPTAGLTAYQIVHRKMAARGPQTVLVFGISGGVGGLAVQIAKAAGHRVIAVAAQERAELAGQLGADAVVAPGASLKATLGTLTDGRFADLVIDTISPDNPDDVLDLVTFNGALASIVGFPDFSRLRWFERGISIHEIALGAAYRFGHPADIADLGAMLSELFALVRQGKVRANIGETVGFAEIPDALARLRLRQTKPGKIVATVFPGSTAESAP